MAKEEKEAKKNYQVEMGGIWETSGACLQGDMPDGVKFDDLLNVFGEPQVGASGDGNVKVQWVGMIDGDVFTIDDWKSNVSPRENTDWNIGGVNKEIPPKVIDYFLNNK